jgi:DNA sulfur modification protein DndE
MSLEHIRLSTQAKEQLIRLKRTTGVKNWNVLCRWAFCVSLADTTKPVDKRISTDSSVEMSWKVFGGTYQDIYLALLKQRCKQDDIRISPDTLAQQFKLHLHRGITQLAGDRSVKTIANLLARLPEFSPIAVPSRQDAP